MLGLGAMRRTTVSLDAWSYERYLSLVETLGTRGAGGVCSS